MQTLLVRESDFFDVIILTQRVDCIDRETGQSTFYDQYVGVFKDYESLIQAYNEKIKDRSTAQGRFYATPFMLDTIAMIYGE